MKLYKCERKNKKTVKYIFSLALHKFKCFVKAHIVQQIHMLHLLHFPFIHNLKNA